MEPEQGLHGYTALDICGKGRHLNKENHPKLLKAKHVTHEGTKKKHVPTSTPLSPRNHNRRFRFALSKPVLTPLHVGSWNWKSLLSSPRIARESLSAKIMPITRKEDIRWSRRAAIGSLSASAPDGTARYWSRLVTISCRKDASCCCTTALCGSSF